MALFSAVALIVVLLDQASKIYVRSHWALGQSVTVIPHLLWITRIANTGAAFGMLPSATPILALLGIGATVVVFLLARGSQTRWILMGYGLLLGGILGNLIDRLGARTVTDFIQVPHFAIFNVADSAITVGTILLVIGYLFTVSR